MNKETSLIVKIIILLFAVCAFSMMIIFPQLEGRAANLDLVSIYKDPFIVYIYVSSIPFYVALHKAFKLVGNIYAKDALDTLQKIKYCSIIFMSLIAGANLYILSMSNTTNDDGAGAIMVGIMIIAASGFVAVMSGIFQKRLKARLNK